jgi:hypothetical protein
MMMIMGDGFSAPGLTQLRACVGGDFSGTDVVLTKALTPDIGIDGTSGYHAGHPPH